MPEREDRETESRSGPNQVMDELMGPRLDWRRMVRTYPWSSLLAATLGGVYLGKRHGWQLITDLSAFAADELLRNVQLALDEVPK